MTQLLRHVTRMICRVKKAGVLVIATGLLGVPWQGVFAEGSAQAGLNQPLLAYGVTSTLIIPMNRPLYVDISSPGQVINFSLCGGSNSDQLRVELRSPIGTVVLNQTLSTSTTGVGRVSCTDSFTTTLTNPLQYVTTSSGAYEVRLYNNDDNEFRRFDITVTPNAATLPDPTVAAGRLWAYSWAYNAGNYTESTSTDADYFSLTPGSEPGSNFIWKLDLNKFAGFIYEIVANGIGVDAPNSGLSVPTSGNSLSADYPVYLGYPVVAGPLPGLVPTASNFYFVDNAGIDSGISPGVTIGIQDSGTFYFDTNGVANYSIIIDTNQDGIYGSGDVLLLGPAVTGTNAVAWDGRDNSGNILPVGSYNARIQVRTGEYHFVASDAETSGGNSPGLTIYRALPGGGTVDTLVFWDDLTVLGGTTTLPNGQLAGRHTWGNFSSTSFGNERYIDTYVYGGVATTTDSSVSITTDDTPLAPDLQITKTDNFDPVGVGTPLSYTILVENIGGQDAPDVVVTDNLPITLDFNSVSTSQGSCSGTSTVTCSLGILTAGGSATITLNVTPNSTGNIDNTATATTTDIDANPGNNSATETTEVLFAIDLALAKSVSPTTVNSGANAVYTLTATNKDLLLAATNVAITDALPAGVSYVSASGPGWICNYAAPNLDCQLASLAANSSAQLDVTVTAISSGTLINAASITSTDFSDSDISDNSASASLLVLSEADLTVIKTTDKINAEDGKKPKFFLDVSNDGAGTADNVVVTDTLPFSNNKNNANGFKEFYDFTKYFFTFPDGTRIQGGSSVRQVTYNGITISVDYNPVTTGAVDDKQPTPLPADGTSVTITWTISPGLNSGDTVQLEFEAKKVDDVQSPNTASVSSDTNDPDPGNNSNTILVGKNTPGGNKAKYADLEVTKAAALNPQATDDPFNIISSIDVNTNFSYVISVLSNGPDKIKKGDAGKGFSTITLVDTLPAGVTYLGFTGLGPDVGHSLPSGVLEAANNVNKGTWSCSFNAPSRELTCTYTLDQGDDFDKDKYSEDLVINVTAPGTGGIITNTADQLLFTVPPAVSSDVWTDPYDFNNDSSWDLNIIPLFADLAINKSVDNATPDLGDLLTYTVTVTNNGPGDTTGVSVFDDFVTGLDINNPLTDITVDTGTTTYNAVNKELTWDIGALADQAVATMTVLARANLTGNLPNTASITSSDLPDNDSSNDSSSIVVTVGVLLSGTVWSDGNHDGIIDGGEAGIPGVTVVLYDTGAASCVSTQTNASGDYSFSGVADGNYQLIEAASETIPAPATCPSTEQDPAGYLSTTANSLSVTVAGANLVNRDFGDFNGSRFEGTVFEDNGTGGGTAHDGIINGAENGLTGLAVEANNGATLDSTTTNASGQFILWVADAASGANVDILTATPGSYISTSKSDGGAGDSSAATALDQISLVPVSGQTYSGLAFGDAREPAFAPDHSRSASPGSTLFYTHTFTAYTSGTASFSTAGLIATPNVPGWNAVLYDDSNCNGALEQGEPLHSAPISMDADTTSQACLIVQVFVPASAPINAQYLVTLAATFSYSATSLSTIRNRTDLTTVGDSSLVLVKVVDKPTAQPGELLTYTITYTNTGSDALSDIIIDDKTPAFTTFSSAGCILPLPANLSGCVASTVPSIGGAGAIQWTFNPGDTLQSGSSGQVQYQVNVNN